MRKSGTEAPRDEETEIDLQGGAEDRDRSPKRRGNIRDRLGPPQPELQAWYPPH